jgi:hypothetical protein
LRSVAALADPKWCLLSRRQNFQRPLIQNALELSMFATIAIIATALLAAVLVFAATKPDSFRVERATHIEAPPEAIFPLINDFRSWGSWSPYEKLDPVMKRTHRGPANGNGAVYEWDGNNKAGQGRMEITESCPPSNITIKLDFIKPFEGHNITEFTLEARGNSTNVTWAMHGSDPYIAKVMTIFFSRDRMVGTQFETGLANLKTVAEKQVAHAILGIARAD